jgi:hypothetical protein
MKTKLLHLSLIALLFSFPARAGSISIDFAPQSVAGSPGETLIFQGSIGTLTSDLGYDAFLNSLTITLAGPFDWNIDATPFLLNAPLTLANGASSGPFEFFTLIIPGGLAGGYYDGEFTVLGGEAPDSEVILGSSGFQVEVAGSPAAVPEPSSLLLAAVGLGTLLSLRLHSQRKSAALHPS